MANPPNAIHHRVDHLWAALACEPVWGDTLPSPARLMASQLPARALVGDSTALDAAGPLRGTLVRIVERVRAFDSGVTLGPVVVGADGLLAEGSHDLAALYLRSVAEVVTVGAPAIPQVETRDVFRAHVLDALTSHECTTAFHRADPYPFFYLTDILQNEIAEGILAELGLLEWQHEKNDLYEQDVATLLDCDRSTVGPHLHAFRTAVLSNAFTDLVSRFLGDPVRIADVACHKSRAGHLIRIHTDHSADREVCRLTLHFTSCWGAGCGGEFLQFRDPSGTPVAIWPPAMNTAVMFRISSQSYHAVAPWTGPGVRYSVVLAFAGSH